jgi:pimeloyl-ACP methyl ester carboxylesterase
MNWLSYRNGTAHLSTMRSSFAGTESWQQIEFATRFQVRASPAVLARGMLGMMHYDALRTLSQISVPALVFTGDRDQLTKPEAGEMIRKGIPTATLKTLAPARHLGLIEQHREYNELVGEFVESVAAKDNMPRV